VDNPQTLINLVYVRAAIEQATGIRLSLEKTRQYLVEEGLITPKQAKTEATIFRGYSDFYEDDSCYASSKEQIEPEIISIEDEIGRENLCERQGLGKENF